MLYLIYGEDGYRARKNTRDIMENLSARNAGAAVLRLTQENASEEKLKNLISGRNLFGQKSASVFDGLMAGGFGDFLASNAEEMSKSSDVYIILEEKPETKLIKKISKFAQKVQKFEKLPSSELEKWIKTEAESRGAVLSPDEVSFLVRGLGSNLWAIAQALEIRGLGGEICARQFLYSPFGFTDLFALKKRRELYAYFHKNFAAGVSAEEIFWKLWWQMKTLLAVAAHKDAGLNSFQIRQKTGLHPFVVQKNLSAVSKFAREELENIWDEMFELWRDSRLGTVDFNAGFERVLLRLF